MTKEGFYSRVHLKQETRTDGFPVFVKQHCNKLHEPGPFSFVISIHYVFYSFDHVHMK